MSKNSSSKYPGKKKIIFAELNRGDKNWFAYYLDQPSNQDLVKELEIISLKKFSMHGYLESSGNSDWQMICFLKCRLVLACRLTLQPFPMSLNTRIARKFVANPKLLSPRQDNAMPEDETLELLTPGINLYELVREALFLEIPDYPTNSDSDFDSSINDDARLSGSEVADNPFAALAKDKS